MIFITSDVLGIIYLIIKQDADKDMSVISKKMMTEAMGVNYLVNIYLPK